MTFRRTSITSILSLGILSLLLAVAITAPKAFADEQDQAIRLTFNQPMAIPDHILAPGSYWFVLPGHGDTKFDNVMQVMDGDKKNVIATLTVEPVIVASTGGDVSGNVLLTLIDRSPNRPQAILNLTYPGRDKGSMFNFRYSKDEQGGFSEFPKVTMKVGKDGVLEAFTDEPKH